MTKVYIITAIHGCAPEFDIVDVYADKVKAEEVAAELDADAKSKNLSLWHDVEEREVK